MPDNCGHSLFPLLQALSNAGLPVILFLCPLIEGIWKGKAIPTAAGQEGSCIYLSLLGRIEAVSSFFNNELWLLGDLVVMWMDGRVGFCTLGIHFAPVCETDGGASLCSFHGL
jgi:hypothetical protein|uniref:Uncharacterized protein n=1 Tax=Picea glauca TaxID=3330 RepID=A0A101M4R2_PICGL|nr:hypothetical protein ABT39_MTgene826 [Picea glauca]QHR87155.1 hypothetical protein Q903MT_gene1164 [Picea sitchensis]